MATPKKLYDKNGTEILPYTHASYVKTNVPESDSTLENTLGIFQSQITRALQLAGGGASISGSLGVVMDYINTTTADKDTVQAMSGWNENMQIPNSTTPYTWKRTRYYWTVDGTPTQVAISYEIVATALYPETQVMYASTGTSISGSSLQGPANYSGDDSGVVDQATNSVRWYYFFPGINGSNSVGYMAVRHRNAGESWPQTAVWKISQMAQYPVSE